MKVLRLIRYRFFLFAGLVPFLLGQVIAYGLHKSMNWNHFAWGLAGIFLVLTAVELFNEYFDAKSGGDRIFSPEDTKIPEYFFPLGILALGLALVAGLYLTYKTGWPVLLFSFMGFLGAYFYVGPPIRWAYRGFGEIVIALCYGPFMVLGSFYIQTASFHFVPLYTSLICGLSVFCLAIVNEIPDFYQDRLVGKKNLVVRLGREKAIILLKLSLTLLFVLIVLGVVLKIIPLSAIAAALTLPWILKNIRIITKNYDNAEVFLPAVNTVVLTYIVVTFSLGIGFWKG